MVISGQGVGGCRWPGYESKKRVRMMRHRGGFTLVELAAVVAVACVLVSLGVGTLGYSRDQASVRSDISDLRQIAQASAMYAEGNQDRLFTFSWKPGEVPDTPNKELAIACGALNPFNSGDVSRAAVYQQLDLVSRNSDFEEIVPSLRIAPVGHTPFPLYNHLVLMHYMGESMPSEKFISAGDRARGYWLDNTEKYLADPLSSKYLPPTSSTSFSQLWRWPFSSSYVTGPSHYSNDYGSLSNNPIPRTVARASNHRIWIMPTTPGVLGDRRMSEVAHPSLKVQMFDDYDRYTGQFGQYFGFDDSASTMVFYDGSAGRFSTASANYGFEPNNPDRGADMPDDPTSSDLYTYSPIAGWDPPGASSMVIPARYDQTRNGLQGIDFSPGSVRRPVRSTGK